jgi:hypothetical protein
MAATGAGMGAATRDMAPGRVTPRPAMVTATAIAEKEDTGTAKAVAAETATGATERPVPNIHFSVLDMQKEDPASRSARRG